MPPYVLSYRMGLFQFIVLALTSSCFAGDVYSDFPERIDSDSKYVFYSHGGIVEGNIRPHHKKFGFYEFEKIKTALANNSMFNLIAHHRPVNSDPKAYAEKLVLWVVNLIDAGVKSKNITLVGFSKGGVASILASSQLKRYNINTVIMAACFAFLDKRKSVTLAGNFLSIYETSDSVGSCKKIADRSNELSSFEELAISTGKGHGAFYKPLSEWMVPLKKWLP